jgi:hypothetical protein
MVYDTQSQVGGVGGMCGLGVGVGWLRTGFMGGWGQRGGVCVGCCAGGFSGPSRPLSRDDPRNARCRASLPQILGRCIASANAPLDAVRRSVRQWLELGVPPKKLVLGLPWYAYDYPCEADPVTGKAPTPEGVDVCHLKSVPFQVGARWGGRWGERRCRPATPEPWKSLLTPRSLAHPPPGRLVLRRGGRSEVLL